MQDELGLEKSEVRLASPNPTWAVQGEADAYQGDKGKDGGLLFVRRQGSIRTVHLHVVHEGSQEWDDYLRFRELLRRNPGARRRYQSAKRELALRFPRDRQYYTEATSAVVEELLGIERRHAAAHAS
jgi:GrpB-like predicted nucleotidyltransferase (UPF0157 family)